MAALLPLLVSPCVTSVPHACCYPPHSACVCAVRRRVHLLRGGKVLECDRRELISDVHLVPRGHILECRCVESVPDTLPPFPRTP